MSRKETIRRGDVGLGATPAGGNAGSYAPYERGTSILPLHRLTYAAADGLDAQRAGVHDRLEKLGTVPAVSAESVTRPESTDGITEWWRQHLERAEHSVGDGVYAIMPDDYTPRLTSGRALSGRRRTHRMKYQGAGVTLRMPSATAIRRFSEENDRRTFDVPIEIDQPGGVVSGWVRLTQGPNGMWDVRALNFPKDHQAGPRAAEAVAAVLESRRPSLALREAQKEYLRAKMALYRGEEVSVEARRAKSALGLRYLQRRARTGAQKIRPEVPSGLVRGGGFDSATNTMFFNLNGRDYAYEGSLETFAEVMHSDSPGRAYNDLVKKRRLTRVDMEVCGQCGRAYRAEYRHVCPVQVSERRDHDDYRDMLSLRLHGVNLAERRGLRRA